MWECPLFNERVFFCFHMVAGVGYRRSLGGGLQLNDELETIQK